MLPKHTVLWLHFRKGKLERVSSERAGQKVCGFFFKDDWKPARTILFLFLLLFCLLWHIIAAVANEFTELCALEIKCLNCLKWFYSFHLSSSSCQWWLILFLIFEVPDLKRGFWLTEMLGTCESCWIDVGWSHDAWCTLSCLKYNLKKKNQLKLGILAKDLSLVSLFQFPVSIVSKSTILSLAINWKTVYWYVKHSGATAVVIPGKWMSRNKGLN